MAPPAADVDIQSSEPVAHEFTKGISKSRLSGPLTYSGSLDEYENFDVTAVIGREFPKLQISEILNDDNKIRDLAILGMSFILNRRMNPKSCAHEADTISSLTTWGDLLPQPRSHHRRPEDPWPAPRSTYGQTGVLQAPPSRPVQ